MSGPARRRRRNPVVEETGEALQEETAVAVEEAPPEPTTPEPAAPRGLRARAAAGRRTSRLGGKAIASYPLRNVGTIAGKELYTYFASPIAYLVIAAFLVMNGYLFSIILFSSRSARLTGTFSDMVIILLFLSPAITMRLLAEEQRTGTIELLLTSPLREAELVLGKWLAAMGFFVVMLALTLPYPLFLMKYGSPDVGPIISGYIGVLLLEGVFLAVGLLMSSFTQNQIVALAMSFGVLLVLWLLQGAGQSFGSGGGASVAQFIALAPHFDGFTSGNVQLKDLVYYVSLIIIALFLTTRSIETRRWR
ncbi:MAG TPA: ABC transporter permease subunit [Chloroflexota bacterium]